MEGRSPRRRKQKNNRKLRDSNKKKNKKPKQQQDIIVFFDDDENNQLTPYEIDLLKSLALEEENDIDLYNPYHYIDEGDIIFSDNSFPRALNKADRKKLKRQMKRESMDGNSPQTLESQNDNSMNKITPTKNQKSTPKKKSAKDRSILFSKFIKAQDPISQLKPTEENEFEIIYYNGTKPLEKKEECNDNVSINDIKKEFENLSINEITEFKEEFMKNDITIEEPLTKDIKIEETITKDIIIEEPLTNDIIIEETITKDIIIEEPLTSDIITEEPQKEEDSLFQTENIQFKDIFVKALEESKLNNEQQEQKKEETTKPKYEIIFDKNETPSKSTSEDNDFIESDQSIDEEFIIFANYDEESDLDDSLNEDIYDIVENDYNEYSDDSNDIFQDEEDNLLYEFYLEHGDSFSDSDSFEKDLSLTDDEDDESDDMEDKHRQILRGSFKEEYRKNKRNSNISSTDSPRSNGSSRKKNKLSKREKKALRRDKRKTKPYDRKDLFRLNMDFRKFISTGMIGDSKPISIPTKTQRRQLILLAGMYGLEVTTIGPKSSQILGIKYCKDTKLIDLKESKKNIRRMMQNPEIKLEKLQKLDKMRSKKKLQVDGKYVGEHSSPISSDNLGHIILKKIGWNGGGLGINEQGIQDPLKVIIKKNKQGLGY